VIERAGRGTPSSSELKRGQGFVLVMDDDDMVRHVAGSMLKHLGYRPILTCDGAEALERTRALLSEGTRLCAALLDLTVRSGEGGRETVRPLRALIEDLPVVASSGYSDDPVMAAPEQFGFTSSLHKPFRLNELGDLLARLVPR
jgi:CheY-like chemotaxis protein